MPSSRSIILVPGFAGTSGSNDGDADYLTPSHGSDFWSGIFDSAAL